MRIDLRRRLYARILLAVFLPMMALTMLHMHDDAGEVDLCQECVMHIHHNGHFSSGSLTFDNCLICQFLSLTYIQAAVLFFIAFIHIVAGHFHIFSEDICQLQAQCVYLRAPPVIG